MSVPFIRKAIFFLSPFFHFHKTINLCFFDQAVTHSLQGRVEGFLIFEAPNWRWPREIVLGRDALSNQTRMPLSHREIHNSRNMKSVGESADGESAINIHLTSKFLSQNL